MAHKPFQIGLALFLIGCGLLLGLTRLEQQTQAQGGSTIYVDGSNTGLEDGSQAHPWNTVGEGLDDASVRDTILVAQGVYTENVTVDKQVTLEGGYESVGWTRNITQYETIIDGSSSRAVERDWDGSGVHTSIVISDAGVYKMWYEGWGVTSQGLGLAISPDGITWTKHAGNPVFAATVGQPCVIKDGTTYKMWYSCSSKIGYAWSSDGTQWTKYANNPVLEGTEGEWDEDGVGAPSVIKVDSNDYRMWYSGGKIGYATSANGVEWTKHSSPVLLPGPSGAWDDEWVADPNVLFDGMTYHMWYAGYDGDSCRIGYAWSSNGITWHKSASNPLLSPGAPGEWDELTVSEPNVLFDGTLYRMWFSGCKEGWQAWQRGYATSLDGIAWVKYTGNPVLSPGTPGQWGQPVVHFVQGSDGAVLDGFRLRNGEAEYGGGALVDGAEATIRNCTVVNNMAQDGGGGIDVRYAHATIAANVIQSNTVRGGGGGGVLVDTAIVTLTNNVIASNVGAVMWWDGDGVVVWGDDSDVRIINNTIARNSAEGVEATGTSTVLVRNNSIVGNEGGMARYGEAQMTIDHNDVWDNGWANYVNVTPGAGDISADPLFVNAAAGDFHLRSDSPCIDAGTNVGAPSTDLEGDPRPDGCFVDIGADEYQGRVCYRIYLPLTFRQFSPLAERRKTVIFDIDGGRVVDPTSWNPYTPGFRLDHGFHQCMMEPLFILNYETGEIEPWLGLSMTANETMDVWTLVLHDGVKWSDGEDFDADDVVFTIQMLLDNAPELWYSAALADWVEKVEKVNKTTVRFTLTWPNPRFQLDYFSVRIWGGPSILPEHIWKDKDPLTFKNYDPAKGWPVFTGPYLLESVSETEFVYVRDDNWWGAQTGWKPLPRPEKLVWVWAGGEQARADLMAEGELDSLMDITLGTLLALKNKNRNVITWYDGMPYAWPDLCSRTFELNHTVEPWSDKEMRWALNYAIDRDQIVAIAYEGTTLKSHHFFPAYPPLNRLVDLLEAAGLYGEYPLWKHDPELAKSIIESKGWELGGDGYYYRGGKQLSLEITCHEAFIEMQRVAQVLVEQFQAMGINATMRLEDGGTWSDNFCRGSFEARVGWHTCGSMNEPWASMDTLNTRWLVPVGECASDNEWRWSGSAADAYSSIVDEIGTLPLGDPQIDDLFVEAMEYWLDELPVIPITQARKIVPFDTTYWVGWPTSYDNPYIHPPTWWQHTHRIIHNLEPAPIR